VLNTVSSFIGVASISFADGFAKFE
jgi:hypothetical protein